MSEVCEMPAVFGPDVAALEDKVIAKALAILERRLLARRDPSDLEVNSPASARDFLKLKLAGELDEVFAVLVLDNRHRLLEYCEITRGTIDSASVYPRSVARVAIQKNAAAVVLAHNHPSGLTEASEADLAITKRLKEALSPLGIRVLDHIIVGEGKPLSLMETGQI